MKTVLISITIALAIIGIYTLYLVSQNKFYLKTVDNSSVIPSQSGYYYNLEVKDSGDNELIAYPIDQFKIVKK